MYLHMLFRRYLKAIDDPISQFYCVIASYNTGLGNMAKTFVSSKRISNAVRKVNTMSADQTLQYLMEHLPAQETRLYIEKIIQRRNKYRYLDKTNRT